MNKNIVEGIKPSAKKQKGTKEVMKKTYQTPVCQTIYTDSQDVLTASFIKFEKGESGSFDENGAVIKWNS